MEINVIEDRVAEWTILVVLPIKKEQDPAYLSWLINNQSWRSWNVAFKVLNGTIYRIPSSRLSIYQLLDGRGRRVNQKACRIYPALRTSGTQTHKDQFKERFIRVSQCHGRFTIFCELTVYECVRWRQCYNLAENVPTDQACRIFSRTRRTCWDDMDIAKVRGFTWYKISCWYNLLRQNQCFFIHF